MECMILDAFTLAYYDHNNFDDLGICFQYFVEHWMHRKTWSYFPLVLVLIVYSGFLNYFSALEYN